MGGLLLAAARAGLVTIVHIGFSRIVAQDHGETARVINVRVSNQYQGEGLLQIAAAREESFQIFLQFIRTVKSLAMVDAKAALSTYSSLRRRCQ